GFRKDGLCPVKPVLANIGNDKEAGPAVAMDDVIYCRQTHWSRSGEDSHSASLDNSHLMNITSRPGMVMGVESARNAGVGFRKGGGEVPFALILKQAIHFHDFIGDNHIGGVSANIGI